MNRRIVNIEKGFADAALPIPYSVARLECGHSMDNADPNVTGYVRHCGACDEPVGFMSDAEEHERSLNWRTAPKTPCCESYWVGKRESLMARVGPHADEAQVHSEGDEVWCGACHDAISRLPEIAALLDSGRVRHTRAAANGIGRLTGLVHIYVRDEKSPTGVVLGGSVDTKIPEVREWFDARVHGTGLSPLSPTEGRSR